MNDDFRLNKLFGLDRLYKTFSALRVKHTMGERVLFVGQHSTLNPHVNPYQW